MAFEVQIPSDTNYDDMDKSKYPVAGWYDCVLTDTGDDDKNGALYLKFDVTAGPFKGCEIKQLLFDPANADDEEKAKRTLQKYMAWAKRMGALTEAEFKAGTQPDWIRQIGSRYVMELEQSKPNSSGKQFVGPKYLGVYPPDHEGIPENVRAELHLPPSRAPHAPRAPATGGGKRGGSKATTPAANGTPAPAHQRAVDVSDL
jgi:hypothetical protein